MRLASDDLLVGGEQVDAADRAQVEPQRVEARLDREVDLGLLRRVLALAPASARPCRRRRDGRRSDTISTPLSSEVRVQVAHLLLGDLDLLEAGGDLLERQIAPLAALGDQRAQLLDLEERRLGCPRPAVTLLLPRLLRSTPRSFEPSKAHTQ